MTKCGYCGYASHPAGAFFQRLKELLKPRIRLALLVGLVIGIAQQITGVNTIYFYAPTLFEQSGIGTNAVLAQAIWVGIVNVIFTPVAVCSFTAWDGDRCY